MLAWNAFESIFPLSLLLVTVLGIVGSHDQHLQTRSRIRPWRTSRSSAPIYRWTSARRTGPASDRRCLVGTILATRGVVNASQNACNALWGLSYQRRPWSSVNLLRSVALVLGFGVRIILTIALCELGSGTEGRCAGRLRLAASAVSLLANVGLFWFAFRLATAKGVPTRDLRAGAALIAVAWQVRQIVGGT